MNKYTNEVSRLTDRHEDGLKDGQEGILTVENDGRLTGGQVG